jgi:hypothetical protein
MAVHGPLFFGFTLAGFLLCWPQPMMRLFVPVWALAGLYLGRDVAIFCHYAPVLTLICWAVSGSVIFTRTTITKLIVQHPKFAPALTAAVGTILFGIANARTRGRRKIN